MTLITILAQFSKCQFVNKNFLQKRKLITVHNTGSKVKSRKLNGPIQASYGLVYNNKNDSYTILLKGFFNNI